MEFLTTSSYTKEAAEAEVVSISDVCSTSPIFNKTVNEWSSYKVPLFNFLVFKHDVRFGPLTRSFQTEWRLDDNITIFDVTKISQVTSTRYATFFRNKKNVLSTNKRGKRVKYEVAYRIVTYYAGHRNVSSADRVASYASLVTFDEVWCCRKSKYSISGVVTVPLHAENDLAASPLWSNLIGYWIIEVYGNVVMIIFEQKKCDWKCTVKYVGTQLSVSEFIKVTNALFVYYSQMAFEIGRLQPTFDFKKSAHLARYLDLYQIDALDTVRHRPDLSLHDCELGSTVAYDKNVVELLKYFVR